ncbi:MAG: MBL fold metallo-hydrolase [Candidatus Gastranaerophilales bacterium]|nr:MBL fold metallo-hydrolase [Candidatus Gastranaerophilales bacterium]
MSKNNFSIKFRGVRGSMPTPNADKLIYGGNTSCVEVNVNGHLIILDAGTGIVSLGDDLFKNYLASGTNEETRAPMSMTLLVSHAHMDHIQGFPFFKPVFINTSSINVFGSTVYGTNFEDILNDFIITPYFPVELGEMAAQISISNLKENEMILLEPDSNIPFIQKVNPLNDAQIPDDTIVIRCMKSHAHPKNGVLIFKISYKGHSIVYASDKECYIGGDTKLASFARNTDILIHDAQYTNDEYNSPILTKQGFGHSTPEMAADAAKNANAKQLVLFHIDPSYNDEKIENMEQEAKRYCQNSMFAKEGLEIKLL